MKFTEDQFKKICEAIKLLKAVDGQVYPLAKVQEAEEILEELRNELRSQDA